MPTVHHPPVSGDPLPPPEVTPYFSREARYRRALRLARAGRGLPPGPRAA